jgi:hypothetical protein
MLLANLVTMTVVPDGVASDVLFGLAIALVPIAAGVAILRHRLYDIDRLINRTLVYAALSAVLGAVYAGAVLVLGLVGGVGGELPSWAVAGATLAVAELLAGVEQTMEPTTVSLWLRPVGGPFLNPPERDRRASLTARAGAGPGRRTRPGR